MSPDQTQPPAEDRVTAALDQLSERDVDPWRAEQIRRRAQAVLARQRALAARPWLAAGCRLYERVLEPAFVLSVTGVYLGWAILAVRQILSGP